MEKPIDCTDDYFMINAGLRQPVLYLHPEIFIKTASEKAELKRMKTKYSPKGSINKSIDLSYPQRLTVHFVNTKKESDFRISLFTSRRIQSDLALNPFY